jgi:phospholipid/cholesterol/gamma-HCH transport system substrate-binding protein
MNPENKGHLVRIGFLVALGLIVMGVVIIGITSKQRLFERKIEFCTYFSDAAGLKEGSSVWFQGVEVGYISRIDFSEDNDNTVVKVTYRIASQLLPRITGDTRAVIKSLGLLGDKFISLEKIPGEKGNPQNLLPGSEIKNYQPVSLRELGQGAQDIMVTLNELNKNMNALVTQVQKGGGPVSRLLSDPKLGNEMVDHTRQILADLDKITARLSSGEGLAGGLMAKQGGNDEAAKDLRASIERLNSLLTGIEEGKGVLGLLVTELNDGKDARQSMVDFFSALATLSKSLEDSDSLLHKLVVDEQYGREMSEHLLSINRSLDAILKKIEKGEGTVGGLVNDPAVYNSLSLTAEGMRKSGAVKWYLEKKAREAAEAEKKAEEEKNKK